MKIELYNCSCEKQYLNKTNFIKILNTFENAVLKDSTSITDPVIIISGVAPVYVTGNYMYIYEFARYYFVDDVYYVKNNLYEFHCHVDVLMSFKNTILGSRVLMERNEKTFEPYVVDPLMIFRDDYDTIDYTFPFKAYGGLNISPTQNNYNHVSSLGEIETAPSIVVNFMSTKDYGLNIDYKYAQDNGWYSRPNGLYVGNTIASRTIILCGASVVLGFIKWISGDNITRSNILSMYLLPYDFPLHASPANLVYDGTNSYTMYIGNDDFTFISNQHKGRIYEISNSSLLMSFIWSLLPNMQQEAGFIQPSNDFSDYSPYTKYSIYIPCYGFYELPSEKFLINKPNSDELQYGVLKLSHAIDWTNGSDTITIAIGKTYIDTVTCQFLCPLPINSTGAADLDRKQTSDLIQFAGNLTTSLFSTAAFGLAGSAAGAISASSGILGSIYGGSSNLVSDVASGHVMQVQSLYGRYCQPFNYIFRITKRRKTRYVGRNSPFNKTIGFRCCRGGALNEYSGFSVCSDIHLNNIYSVSSNTGNSSVSVIHYALKSELDEIEQLCKHGIFLP